MYTRVKFDEICKRKSTNQQGVNMSKIVGGCLCGQIRYESSSIPIMVAACHCTHCRKQSGTAFSVIVGVTSDSLTISGDSLRTFNDIGSSGRPVERSFCSACGSALYSRASATEDILYFKAGSLDNSDWVEPNVEIWCNSQVSWSTLKKDMTSFPTTPRTGGR